MLAAEVGRAQPETTEEQQLVRVCYVRRPIDGREGLLMFRCFLPIPPVDGLVAFPTSTGRNRRRASSPPPLRPPPPSLVAVLLPSSSLLLLLGSKASTIVDRRRYYRALGAPELPEQPRLAGSL